MENLFDEICIDKFWDPQSSWNSTSPRLTKCFRETVLIWIPFVFLFVCLPIEIVSIIKSKIVIQWNKYNVFRQIICLALLIVSIVDCIVNLVKRNEEISLPARTISGIIRIFSYIILFCLFLLHRKRGIHTSGVAWIYLLFQVVCNAPSLWMFIQWDQPPADEWIIFCAEYLFIICLFILLCFADSLPKSIDKAEKLEKSMEKLCPKADASFLSRIFFWWFNDMAILGWKKTLETSDLWQITPGDKCSSLVQSFNKHWNSIKFKKGHFKQTNISIQNGIKTISNGISRFDSVCSSDSAKLQESKRKPGIVWTLTKTFWWYFLSATIFKLGYDVPIFIQPQILGYLIRFIQSQSDQTSEPDWHGYFYTVLLLIVTILQMLCINYYFRRVLVLGMRIRACLVGAIYRKSLRLSNSSKSQSTSGEIVNLMAVDAQRFMDLMLFVNMIWSAPLQICLALYFLWQELGVAMIGGMVIMVLTFPINGIIFSILKKKQTKQMKFKDERVKVINEVLSGIRVLKLYGWEQAFKEKILGIRDKELNELKTMNYINCITHVTWFCSPFLVSLASFAVYVLIDQENTLTAQKAFVSLTLFYILKFPLAMLPNLITTMILTSVSIKRINRFLNSSELGDYVVKKVDSENDVTIQNGTFNWKSEDSEDQFKSAQLKDINLKVPRGSLFAIVGSVGSGKSSLLSAILGEIDKINGEVSVSTKKIAYVPQQAWIQNTSLKNNITFGQKYDKNRYDNVINVCALEPDLAILPGGDETEIGEKGINLSGGQKQRVSLARACYSDAELFLFDDPLSAVDSHVGKHIFDRVLHSKTGLLKNKTRILVTNGLSVLPDVDTIVVIKDGKISEMGTYDELMNKQQDFAELLNQYSIKNEESSETKKADQEKEGESNAKQEKTKLVEAERAEVGGIKFTVYWRYFKSVRLWWCLAIILCYLVMEFSNGGTGIWLAEWSKDNSTGIKDDDFRQTIYRISVYASIGLVQAIAVVLGHLSMTKGSVNATSQLHLNMLDRILHSPMSFFDTTPLGRILHRFSKDVDTCDNVLPPSFRVWLVCFFASLTTIIIITIQVPIFLVVVAPMALVYYLIQKFFIVTSRQLKRLESVTRSPIYSHFSETLSGVATIRAYGADRRFVEESDKRVDQNQLCYFPNIIANRWLSVRLELLGNLVIFFASMFAVIYKNELNPGTVGLMITYALNITQNLNWMVRMTAEIEMNAVGIERILEYSDLNTEAEWFINQTAPSVGWPEKGNIIFDEYATRYREGLDNVLNGIEMRIKAGEKIGIVGRTGAGKSSLTLALFRLIEPTNGTIIIDDVDIAKIGLNQLRSRLTIIPQDPVLFSGTLRSNLDPFNQHSDEAIWRTLELAHLKSFVVSLDDGLQHKVSESGENLSVGQRQLICLARALLRNTKVLVLDEATAAVDLETDSLIQTTIRRAFADCTVLTIAHRLHTILDSNRVLVLSAGQIAEFDAPEKLLADSNSIFYSLAKDAGIVS